MKDFDFYALEFSPHINELLIEVQKQFNNKEDNTFQERFEQHLIYTYAFTDQSDPNVDPLSYAKTLRDFYRSTPGAFTHLVQVLGREESVFIPALDLLYAKKDNKIDKLTEKELRQLEYLNIQFNQVEWMLIFQVALFLSSDEELEAIRQKFDGKLKDARTTSE